MTAITAEIHIDISSSSSSNLLPNTPIPYTSASSSQTLEPSTQLSIPVNTTPNSDKPQALENLAEAMDETRARLNQVLTSWKEWAGKEEAPNSAAKKGDADDEEEEEEEE